MFQDLRQTFLNGIFFACFLFPYPAKPSHISRREIKNKNNIKIQKTEI